MLGSGDSLGVEVKDERILFLPLRTREPLRPSWVDEAPRRVRDADATVPQLVGSLQDAMELSQVGGVVRGYVDATGLRGGQHDGAARSGSQQGCHWRERGDRVPSKRVIRQTGQLP